jgi:hypothetical protein
MQLQEQVKYGAHALALIQHFTAHHIAFDLLHPAETQFLKEARKK